MHIPHSVKLIASELQSINAKPIIVGGFVRDSLMKRLKSKDIDIEVYGIEDIELLRKSLEKLAPVYEVGKSFGVLKMSFMDYELDISLPRLESKTGSGHRGFSVKTHADISFKQASSRRDFTMNAIGYDVEEQRYLDPHQGQKDIENRLIRIVNKESFVEDPLRILRAIQFSARLDFTLEKETLSLCQKMVADKMLDELPKERIFEEIKKLLLQSDKPSKGFILMDELGALFPEIVDLKDVPQNPKYHPEGDVFTHTMMSLDALAQEKIDDDKEKLILMLAILCHDFGKPETTKVHEGVISAINHENVGLKPTEIFIRRLSDESALFESIAPLVAHHLKPSQLFSQKSKSSAIRRLSVKVDLKRLVSVARADFLGRTTKEAQSGFYEAGKWLLEEAERLHVLTQAPQALLQGRDLIKAGLEPGSSFKVILDQAYELQLEGEFSTNSEARIWLENYIYLKEKSR